MRNITVLITNFITKYKIYIGFDAVVEWIKPLSEALASSCQCAWEDSEARLECLSPCIHTGGLEKVLSSWLWTSPVIAATAAICRVTQWIDLSLCISLLTVPFKYLNESYVWMDTNMNINVFCLWMSVYNLGGKNTSWPKDI